MGGRVSIAALILRDRLAVLEPGDQLESHQGDPLGCGAALAYIDIILRDKHVKKVREISEYL